MEKTKVCIFDAYGTLFDVNAACRELSIEVGEKWEELATLWRLRQVEYTWLRNSMNEYIDFWKITENALEYAMEVLNIENKILKNKLLDLYLKLEAYPEVENILTKLKERGFKTGILSNGSDKMLESAVKNAQIENLLDEVYQLKDVKYLNHLVRFMTLLKILIKSKIIRSHFFQVMLGICMLQLIMVLKLFG